MRVVIDTNRIIAALIKEGISRRIIFNRNFEFIAPDYAIEEIYKYEEEIKEKANITHEEFDILVSILFEKIEVFPASDYVDFMPEAEKLIEDIGDVPFVALALALKIDYIWSEDSHFQKQKKIKVYKTEQMAGFV